MRLDPLDWMFLGNTVRGWIVAAAVLALVIAGLVLLRRLVITRLEKRALATRTKIDDAITDLLKRTRFLFILFVGLTIAARVLVIPEEVRRWLGPITTAALLLQMGLWGVGLVVFWGRQYLDEGREHDPGSVTAVRALLYGARFVVWLIVFLAVLANFHVDVTALVAGLGVTGIAVALAVQSILGDMIGALSIVMTKPFVVGESVALGTDVNGTVEAVGLRTTRVRSAGGEQYTVPNKQILENTVRNWSRMHQRRVPLVIGVIFETPRDVLAALPGELRAAVEAHGDTVRFERAHLKGLSAGSIDFEMIYWITTSDYQTFMDVQQAVVLDVLRRFDAKGAALAYPSQRAIPYEYGLGADAPSPVRGP